MTNPAARGESIGPLAARRRPGTYAVVHAGVLPEGVQIFASVLEEEGNTFVVALDEAHRHRLPVAFVAAWLSLVTESCFEDLGLTAAFSAALAAEGIACNVLAGAHRDHLLVRAEEADRALAVLASAPPWVAPGGGVGAAPGE